MTSHISYPTQNSSPVNRWLVLLQQRCTLFRTKCALIGIKELLNGSKWLQPPRIPVNVKAHGEETSARGNKSQSEATKRLVLDISVCTGRFELYTSNDKYKSLS